MIDMSGLMTLPINVAQMRRKVRDELLRELYENAVITIEQCEEWQSKSTLQFSNDVDAWLKIQGKGGVKNETTN